MHGPCCAEAAREWQGSPGQREPRLRSQAGGVGGLPGRGRLPSRESRAPGGCPRDQGGDPGSAGRCGQALSARAGGKLVPEPWGLDGSAHGPPPVRVVLARVASQGLAAPGGRRGGGGRPARRWRERPGGRGWVRRSLLHSRPVRQAQAVADEAGNFPTLPAPAAIVTLTETYPVHRHGNAHPFPESALLPVPPLRLSRPLEPPPPTRALSSACQFPASPESILLSPASPPSPSPPLPWRARAATAPQPQ